MDPFAYGARPAKGFLNMLEDPNKMAKNSEWVRNKVMGLFACLLLTMVLMKMVPTVDRDPSLPPMFPPPKLNPTVANAPVKLPLFPPPKLNPNGEKRALEQLFDGLFGIFAASPTYAEPGAATDGFMSKRAAPKATQQPVQSAAKKPAAAAAAAVPPVKAKAKKAVASNSDDVIYFGAASGGRFVPQKTEDGKVKGNEGKGYASEVGSVASIVAAVEAEAKGDSEVEEELVDVGVTRDGAVSGGGDLVPVAVPKSLALFGRVGYGSQINGLWEFAGTFNHKPYWKKVSRKPLYMFHMESMGSAWAISDVLLDDAMNVLAVLPSKALLPVGGDHGHGVHKGHSEWWVMEGADSYLMPDDAVSVAVAGGAEDETVTFMARKVDHDAAKAKGGVDKAEKDKKVAGETIKGEEYKGHHVSSEKAPVI